MLSRTKALLFNALVDQSTSVCCALSLDNKASAVDNSAFAASIADAVFSVTPAFAIAACILPIAARSLLVSAFTTSLGSFSGLTAFSEATEVGSTGFTAGVLGEASDSFTFETTGVVSASS